MRVIGLVLSILSGLMGTTYHVDKYGVHGTPGNDSNSGRSWSQSWATVSKAGQTLQAGDTVLVAAGTYREALTPLRSGAAGRPIVYQTSEHAVIAGSEPVNEEQFTAVPGYPHTYRLYVPQFEVRGVTQLSGHDTIRERPFQDTARAIASVEANHGSCWYNSSTDTLYIHTNDGTRPDSLRHNIELVRHSYCLQLVGKDWLVFKGFTIRHGYNGNAMLYNENATHLVFEDLTIRGGGMMSINCRNLVVRGCSFGRSVLAGTQDRGGASFNLTNVDTAYVVDTEIFDGHNVGFVKTGSSRVVFERCRWWNTRVLGGPLGCITHGFMVGGGNDQNAHCTNITFQNCEGGARCQEGIVILFADTVKIENCALSNVRTHAQESAANHSTFLRLWNTMLHQDTSNYYCAGLIMLNAYTVSEFRADYNCNLNPWSPTTWVSIAGNYLTLAQWRTQYGQDIHSVNLWPLVVNNRPGPGHPGADYRLRPTSPCIDAGDPSYPVPPGGGPCIDIGAYEYITNRIDAETSERVDGLVIGPNPFRRALSLGLLRRRPAAVKIYQADGRLVDCLVLEPGRLREWRPEGLPGGIYFIGFEDQNAARWRKVVYLQ